jgi:dihydrolipoamide dehydrogenase
VTLIESREVGGTCLNRGCVPTKALIGSLEALEKTRKAEAFGFSAGVPAPDPAAMHRRKERIVAQFVGGVEKLLAGHGVRLVRGRGRLVSGNRAAVTTDSGDVEITASRAVLIATGSEPARPAAFPFDGTRVMTSNEALGLTVIPPSVLIVGAGAIGMEFARIFRSLGAEVTVVEMLAQVLPGVDGRAAQALAAGAQRRGIRLLTATTVERIEPDDDGVLTTLSNGESVPADRVLVSTGRSPNSAGLGLEALGVRMRKGFVETDETGRTAVDGLYAAGDVAGKRLLAYTAAREGMRAVEHALGRRVPVQDGIVPMTVFSDPEVAVVGLSEKEALDRGIDAAVGRFPFAASAKALAIEEPEGFVALVADRATDRLVGGQIVGPHASDLISEITLAIRLGATAADVASTLHSHPTLSECVAEAAHDVHGEAIHFLRKKRNP